MAVMAAIVVPDLWQRLPGYERKQFVTQLNQLCTMAWQNALRTHRLHRLHFDLEKDVVTIEIEQPAEPGSKTKPTFVQLPTTYQKATYQWAERFQIKQFFIDGADQMTGPERKIQTLWFFVVPEGLAQEVIINILDVAGEQPVQIGLALNPFTVQFDEYDSFQKP